MNSETKRPVILVVEDDPIILLDVIDSFEGCGFEVIDASSADIGILRFENRPDIAALFTDAHMPGRLNGIQLAKIVRERRSNVQILVTSGVTSLNDQAVLEPWRFIAKPFKAIDVAMRMKAMLNSEFI